VLVHLIAGVLVTASVRFDDDVRRKFYAGKLLACMRTLRLKGPMEKFVASDRRPPAARRLFVGTEGKRKSLRLRTYR
jgi:hypothetical protein